MIQATDKMLNKSGKTSIKNLEIRVILFSLLTLFSVSSCEEKGHDVGFTHRTQYNIVPGYSAGYEEHAYSELVEDHKSNWTGTEKKPYIPEATVSWDACARGTKSWYYTGSTPEAYDIFLTWMVQWMDEHPEQVNQDRLAVVCAWNELDEGSILVPTRRDPDGKIKCNP